MSDLEVIDGSAVEEHSADLVPTEQAQASLFRTNDPIVVIERATRVADKLTDVLKRQGLTSRIGNKDHVNVEGWQTVGAMVGVTPRKDWVRAVPWPADEFLTDGLRAARDRGLTFGYESSYFAQTLWGQVVGGAEATCKRTEENWADSDDYAIESMAQTRATSKALASVLRWIVTLAGYSGTPAEEMDGSFSTRGANAQGGGLKVTEKQVDKFILPNKRKLGISDDDFARYLSLFGIERIEDLPRGKADEFVKAMSAPISEQVSDPAQTDVPPDMDGLGGGDPGPDEPFAD